MKKRKGKGNIPTLTIDPPAKTDEEELESKEIDVEEHEEVTDAM